MLLDASHGPIFAATAVLLLGLWPPAARASLAAQSTAFLGAVALAGVAAVARATPAGRDAAHDMDYRDRFNLPVAIPPRTRTTVRVALAAVEAAPQSRRMDMARVADVRLLGQRGDGAGEFYLSRLWLE